MTNGTDEPYDYVYDGTDHKRNHKAHQFHLMYTALTITREINNVTYSPGALKQRQFIVFLYLHGNSRSLTLFRLI